jgi:glycosyltransferase involved in cell wall biosynthesis
MIRILTSANAGNLLANAGQAAVERALLRGLAATGQVQLRLVLQGDAVDIARVAAACRAEVASGALELVASPDGLHHRHAEGMTGIMEHGSADPALVNALPVVLHLHSLELDPQARYLLAASCRRWDRVTPYVVLAPSHSTAARARWIHARACPGARLPPVLVLPHGVDARWIAGGDRARGRAALGVTPSSQIALSLNRLAPKKLDYRQLLAAFAAVARGGRDRVLVLAGGISPDDRGYPALIERWAIQLGVADRVQLRLHVDEAAKPDLLAAADVLVSTATNPQESFGLVLLEGAAAGLPVVSTDWNGYREVLPEAYRRWSVATVASHALARALDWRGDDASLTRASAAVFDGLVAALDDALATGPGGGPSGVIDRGRAWARRRDWALAAGALVALWDEVATGRSAFPDPGAAPSLCSPVDGLATRYLDGATRVTATGRDPVLALDQLADGRPLPRALLDQAIASCRGGTTLAALRATLPVELEDTDDLVLELVRFGAVALAPAAPSGRDDPP